jgi:hypothetical protein
MKRLFTLTLGSTLILTIATFAAGRIGEANPIAFAAIFTKPDGSPCEMPCMFGIRPGEMSSDKAAQIAKSHPLLQGWEILQERSGDLSVSNHFMLLKTDFIFGTTMEVVDFYEPYNIYDPADHYPLSPLDDITMAQVIMVLGLPDAVLVEEVTQFSYTSYRIVIYFRNDDYEVSNPRDSLSPTDRFIGMTLTEAFVSEEGYPFTEWIGFATRSKYSQHRLSRLH